MMERRYAQHEIFTHKRAQLLHIALYLTVYMYGGIWMFHIVLILLFHLSRLVDDHACM
jgi:hypothetical protein